MKHRIPILVIAITALLAGIAVPASAQQEVSGKPAKVELVTKKTPAILQGGQAWIALDWRGAGSDATDFRITATTHTRGVEVSYPETTGGSYSSLMDNAVLSADEIDFTALHLVVPYGTKQFKIKVTASWNDGKKDVKKSFNVTVPTVAYSGDDVSLVTEEAATHRKGKPSQIWVDVEWSGLAPSISDVRMTVRSPDGSEVAYPHERTWSGLDRDDRLDAGETDVARFRLDPATVKSGQHRFEVMLSYTRDGAPHTTSGVVAVSVDK